MHPTEKTLRIYKEDNELLRTKNDQLSKKITTLQEHINLLNKEIKLFRNQNEKLSQLYQKELNRTKKPISFSVEITQERIKLLEEVKEMVENYDGPRSRYYATSHATTGTPSLSSGSYVLATELYDHFIRLNPQYSVPPTFRIFCKQLNLLGLPRGRARVSSAIVTHRPKSLPSSKTGTRAMGKLYTYFISYPDTPSNRPGHPLEKDYNDE